MGSTSSKSTKKWPTKEEDEEACSFAMAIACGSAFPVLKVVIELDVLEIIKKAGPSAHMSSAQIITQLPTNNPEAAAMLDRMLRLLASYSILTHSLKMLSNGTVEHLYGLAPVSKFLTKNEDGVSFAPLFVGLQDKVLFESWSHLKDTILEGGGPAFNKAYGLSLYQYCGTNPRFNSIFNEAMPNPSTIIMKNILKIYDGFEGLSSIVDVGGGSGATRNMILSKYPKIRCINFDVPHVIKKAPSYTGVEHVEGDMFVSVPEADAIFMKWICHIWKDEECIKLLKNCYTVLPNRGNVILCEHIPAIKPEASNSTKTTFDIDAMMLAHTGGKERTEKEFEALAKEAGFVGFKVACSAYNTTVMELFKKN